MTISHWGIFPGFFVSGLKFPLARGFGSATWKPMPWEAWCAMRYHFDEPKELRK